MVLALAVQDFLEGVCAAAAACRVADRYLSSEKQKPSQLQFTISMAVKLPKCSGLLLLCAAVALLAGG